eukprot:COSAG01_NODE_1342_length_10639_cov_81.961206_8_plen_66_part_00
MAPPYSMMKLTGWAAQVVCKQTYAYMAFPAHPDGSGGPTLAPLLRHTACCQRTGCCCAVRPPRQE